MIKLYTVRIEREFVFASTAATLADVQDEAELALLRGQIDTDEVDDDVEVRDLSYLPVGYDKDSIPYGDAVEDDTTIGELIDAGAAPQYTLAQERLKDVIARRDELLGKK